MIPSSSLSRRKASCSTNRVTKACFPTNSSHLRLDPSFRPVALTPSPPCSLLEVYYEVFIRVVILISRYGDRSPALAKERADPPSCALLPRGEGSGPGASVSPVPSFPESCWDSVVFKLLHQSVCSHHWIQKLVGGASVGRWTNKQTVLLPKCCFLRQPCKKEIARLF